MTPTSSVTNAAHSSMSASVSLGQADHQVELEALHPVGARELGGALEVLDARAALEGLAQRARSCRPSPS
jgi:hypothetical protein